MKKILFLIFVIFNIANCSDSNLNRRPPKVSEQKDEPTTQDTGPEIERSVRRLNNLTNAAAQRTLLQKPGPDDQKKANISIRQTLEFARSVVMEQIEALNTLGIKPPKPFRLEEQFQSKPSSMQIFPDDMADTARLAQAPAIHPGDKSPDTLKTENKKQQDDNNDYTELQQAFQELNKPFIEICAKLISVTNLPSLFHKNLKGIKLTDDYIIDSIKRVYTEADEVFIRSVIKKIRKIKKSQRSNNSNNNA